MKTIFETGKDDWSAYSAGYGKGITRALRHILDTKSARLIWWRDEEIGGLRKRMDTLARGISARFSLTRCAPLTHSNTCYT